MKHINKANTLICEEVKFYASKDEDAFFESLKKIEWIDLITLKNPQQLNVFINEDNKMWFRRQ